MHAPHHVHPGEAAWIFQIVERAAALCCADHDLPADHFDAAEDAKTLMICHANGCPLDLQRLAGAFDNDLLHDVAGIEQHLDRTTGQLRNGFRPYFALPTPAELA